MRRIHIRYALLCSVLFGNIMIFILNDRTIIKHPLLTKEELTTLKSTNSTALYSRRCENVTRPVNTQKYLDVWHVAENNTHTVYIYSAIFDDRPAGGPLPYIRLLSLGTKLSYIDVLLWLADERTPVSVNCTMTLSGRGHRIRGKKQEQYFFSCPLLSASHRPVHVSVILAPCDNPQNLIPVFYPPREQEHEFGICMVNVFWDVDPYRLLEWMELERELGVTEINIHINNITNSDALKVIDYYSKNDTLLKSFQLPTTGDGHTIAGTWLPSTISINDCMLRNMYRYKLVVVIDVDEIIVPRRNNSYRELIEMINALHNVKDLARSYTFKMAYYWISCNTSRPEPKHSYVFRYLHREKPNGFLYGSKSMVDPRRCLSLFNHYCFVQFPGLQKPWTIDVSRSIGLVAHYRVLPKNKKCNNITKLVKFDNYMLRYESTVWKRVTEKVKQIGLRE